MHVRLSQIELSLNIYVSISVAANAVGVLPCDVQFRLATIPSRKANSIADLPVTPFASCDRRHPHGPVSPATFGYRPRLMRTWMEYLANPGGFRAKRDQKSTMCTLISLGLCIHETRARGKKNGNIALCMTPKTQVFLPPTKVQTPADCAPKLLIQTLDWRCARTKGDVRGLILYQQADRQECAGIVTW